MGWSRKRLKKLISEKMSDQNIEWTKLAEERSFENNSEQLHKIKRDDILIVKDDDGFHAINNRCPHLGLALNLGGCDLKNKPSTANFIQVTFLMIRVRLRLG